MAGGRVGAPDRFDKGGGMDDHALISVADAARRLDRSTEQVRRYLREGRLHGRRIGGQWFIEREVLDAFSAAMRAQQSFVARLRPAADIHPLDAVIGVGRGPGTNIAQGKNAYRRIAWRRR